MKEHIYYVYITTNPTRSTLYIGVTNDIGKRLQQHYENRGNQESFPGRYYCYNLVYCEVHEDVECAIEREKEIKKWRREKKVKLIEEQNPDWRFMNNDI
jgi:putative endonuclease